MSSQSTPSHHTVMLIDDMPAILSELSELVESTGIARVIATETDGARAVASALHHSPDMILLDVSIPVVNGIDITRELLAVRPDARVLAVSAHANPIYVRCMLEAGARGYLLKDDAVNEMDSAIRAVMGNMAWISASLSGN